MGPRTPWCASFVTGTIFFALLLAIPGILADPDTLWQIRTGHLILDTGTIPRTDPFSYTAFGQPWSPHEWLAETLMALADRAGGLRGVMALTALAAGTTAGLLLYHLRRFMRPLPAVFVMLQGIANCAGSLLARPHVLAWPCLELWCAGLVLARARGTRPPWWLLAVMAVWVNLHGSFMLGLMLPFAFGAEAAVAAGSNWRQPARAWALFAAAAWAAALLNPDTVGALLLPFRLLGMRNLGWIGEWTPADFSALHPLELTILILLGAGLLGRLTVPPFRLLMLLGLIHMALRHWRHDQLVGLIGSLLLAESVGRMTGGAAVSHDSGPDRWRIALPAGALLLAAAALAARFAVPLASPPGSAVLALLDRVPASLRAKPVLNDYGFGAYLIAHGDRPFIDSRADMYGDDFLGRFRAIVELKPGALAEALDRYNVAWTIFPPGAPVLSLMDQRQGWHRLDLGPAAVIHVRDDAMK